MKADVISTKFPRLSSGKHSMTCAAELKVAEYSPNFRRGNVPKPPVIK